ncbi:hypothetical protein HDU96_003928, partial [Phlyctochytrium bullatum]
MADNENNLPEDALLDETPSVPTQPIHPNWVAEFGEFQAQLLFNPIQNSVVDNNITVEQNVIFMDVENTIRMAIDSVNPAAPMAVDEEIPGDTQGVDEDCLDKLLEEGRELVTSSPGSYSLLNTVQAKAAMLSDTELNNLVSFLLTEEMKIRKMKEKLIEEEEIIISGD